MVGLAMPELDCWANMPQSMKEKRMKEGLHRYPIERVVIETHAEHNNR